MTRSLHDVVDLEAQRLGQAPQRRQARVETGHSEAANMGDLGHTRAGYCGIAQVG